MESSTAGNLQGGADSPPSYRDTDKDMPMNEDCAQPNQLLSVGGKLILLAYTEDHSTYKGQTPNNRDNGSIVERWLGETGPEPAQAYNLAAGSKRQGGSGRTRPRALLS